MRRGVWGGPVIRPEYDAVVAWHPYRTHQPWDHGGVRLLHLDGANGPNAEATRRVVAEVEGRLLNDAVLAGIRGARADNHYGFTVRLDGGERELEGGAVQSFPATYLQLRFSDGSLYVWLMPGPPPEVPA